MTKSVILQTYTIVILRLSFEGFFRILNVRNEGESMDYSKNERIYDHPAIFRINRIPCRRSFDFQGAVLDLAIKNRHTTT